MNVNPKVAIVVTSTGWGGLEMNTLKLAAELQKKGCDISFIVKKDSRLVKEIGANFGICLELDSVKKYFDFKNAKKVSEFVQNEEIDILFSSYRPDLDLISWVKRRTNRPLKVIHQQHMQIGIAKKGLIQRMRYKAIDSWIAPLNWLKEEVIEKTTVNATKISVIPIGLKVEKFTQSNVTRSEAQQLFNCSTTDTLLGVIGRIDSKKGQLFLAQAIEQLRQEGEKVSLLIVGEPTINDPKGKAYYDELMNYIVSNELQEHVFMADFTTNVTTFYSAIDVFVMSSVGETYGMVTLEAMLSKVPVIGTNSGGTTEILGEGEFGELYEVDHLDSFCISYQNLWRRLENNELNLERIQKQTIENYELQKEVEGVYHLIDSI